MKLLHNLPRPIAALVFFLISLGVFIGGSFLLGNVNPFITQHASSMESYPGRYHRYEQGIGGGANVYDSNQRKDMTCSSFKTHSDAQAFFERSGGPANDPYNFDKDGDGIACNSNP